MNCRNGLGFPSVLIALMLFAILTIACAQPVKRADQEPAIDQAQSPPKPVTEKPVTETPVSETKEPTVEVAPIEHGGSQWNVVTSDTATFTVTAPGAEQVKILYRPIVVEGRYIELGTLTEPTDRTNGKFSTELKIPPDFIGDVWAEVSYPDGTKKETRPITVMVKTGTDSAEEPSASESTNGSANGNIKGSIKPYESARSDKITGGRIEKASLKEGDPNIKITVNVPAFQLTLWQSGKEIKTYSVGVGRKDFPIAIGERKAKEIIWNPTWVPPDSSWVYKKKVEPGEHVEAGDPRNPLGKIKIPLGNAYLIHETRNPSDLGNLVSHGCIRMLTSDLFDLVEKIIVARGLPVSREEIDRVKTSTARMVTKLDSPIPVDINYDTQVIEGGILHLYPDVYDRGTNSIENLRAELQSGSIDASNLDNQELEQMMGRVSRSEEFVVSVTDIKAGRSLEAGQNQPLTEHPVKKKPSRRRRR